MKGSTSKRGEATEESRVVRLIDPKAEAVPVSIDIGDGGIIRRFGFQECMDGPAPLASVRPRAALREVRLNRFPEALAEVLRHRVGAGRRHLRDTSLTGMSDAAKGVKPAYPLSYNGAGEGLAPAPPSNPPLFALPRRSRMGAPPPFPRVGAP